MGAARTGCRPPRPGRRAARTRRPTPRRRRSSARRAGAPAPSTSSVSNRSWTSSTSITPRRRRRAENALAEPTRAPVCASVARAAASERPTFRQTTALPASVARSSARENAAGRRTASRKSPITLGRVVLGQAGDEIGRVAVQLAPARDDAAKADTRATREEGLAHRARLGDDGDAARQERGGDRADPGRGAVRAGDAHAVRPDHRGPRAIRERPDAIRRSAGRPRRPPRRSRGRRARARQRRARTPTASSTRAWATSSSASSGVSAASATDGRHGCPATSLRFGIHEHDLRVAAKRTLDRAAVALRRADDRDRAREEQRPDAAAQVLVDSGHSSRHHPAGEEVGCTRSESRSAGATWTPTAT